ncbi:MAG: DUF5667 domain-containing protein [Patescibacteria group bacterium]
MFDFLNKDKLPKNAKKYFLPSKEFIERGETIFLSRFRERFPMERTAGGFALTLKITMVMAIAFVATNVAAVYADEKNVDSMSPLYPLKRYSEVLQVAFTNSSNQSELHVEFAKRRLEEIEILNRKISESDDGEREIIRPETKVDIVTASTSAAPSQWVLEPKKNDGYKSENEVLGRGTTKPGKYNERIESLIDDLGREVEFSLDKIGDSEGPEKKTGPVCMSLRVFVATGSSDIVDRFVDKKPDILKKFESKCFGSFDAGEKENKEED